MKIYYSSKFASQYKKLPVEIKRLAEKKEKIFRANIFNPQLETHKLKGVLGKFLSFSINRKYRIIFEIRDREAIWFHAVGDHSIYGLWE